MSVRNLIPRNLKSAAPAASTRTGYPLVSLQREMNRLFDDVFQGFGIDFPTAFNTDAFQGAWPRLEVSDGEKEVRLTAELPGLDQKDVEVLLEDGILTIRGEKRAQNENSEKQFSERFYGRFERRVQVGDSIREDDVHASFKNGVLEVVLPKDEAARPRRRRIELSS